MQTPAEDERARELLVLLTDQLADAVKASANRREYVRLVRMQGHVAELSGLVVPAPAQADPLTA